MKSKPQLNTYVFSFFILMFTVIIIGDTAKYQAYKQTLIQNYKNKYINKTQQIRENYRLLFDKLQYDFDKAKLENLSKINQLLQIYKRDKSNFNIQDAVDELNKDKIFGEYQIFFINKKYIIEKASYKNDLGMDLGQFKVLKNLFDSVFTKKIDIDISPIKIDSSSMNFTRFLLKLSDDGKYILQIGFVLDIYKDLQKEYLSIKNIKKFELYLSTQNVIQKIELNKNSFSKKSLSESWEETKDIFLNLTEYSRTNSKKVNEIFSSDVKNNNIVINQEIDTIFTDDKLITHFDLKKNSLIIYSITDGLFNETNETKLIIKSHYSTKKLQDDIDRVFNRTILQLFIVLFVLVLMYLFILRTMSKKLLKIIKNITINQYSDIKNIQVNEIEILNNSYNNLHDSLNQKNEKLQKALDEIKTLKGIVPICAHCKKIRDDKGYWNLLESYIEKHSEASFSHGMCPDCLEEFYGKEAWYIKRKKEKE